MIIDAVASRNVSSQHLYLREMGIDARVENWGGKMHMKTAIADGKTVLIGSMNWSNNGTSVNDENTIIIDKAPHLASELLSYFDDLWDSLPESPEDPNDDPHAEGPDSINSCFDGIDNNHSGGADADDWACEEFYY